MSQHTSLKSFCVVFQRRLVRRTLIVAGLLLLWIIGQGIFPTKSRADLLEGRVARLESENYLLRSRLDQLESRLSGVRGTVRTLPSEQQSAPRISSQDPQFKRLATLAIEQKERMDALERRLSRLETEVRK